MNFTYDFANGTTEIVYHPEKKRIPEKLPAASYLHSCTISPSSDTNPHLPSIITAAGMVWLL